MRWRCTKKKQWFLQWQVTHLYLLVILRDICMLLVCHSYLIARHANIICMLLVCQLCVLLCHLLCSRMPFTCHSFVIRMQFVCTRMSFSDNSYVIVCHLYVTRMLLTCHSYAFLCHSYVIINRMSFVCHSYVLVCTRMSPVCTRVSFVYHSYGTRMYSYVTHMVLKTCSNYKNIIRRGQSPVKYMEKRNGNWQGDDVISKTRCTTSVTT